MEKSFLIKFRCSTCNKEHIGPPSFAFDSPYYYHVLNEEGRAKSSLSPDLCTVLDTDYFIRVVLQIPIIGATEPFTWGVWVSQSKDHFEFYAEHFKDDLTGRHTFGWFSSMLPEYESTLGLKTSVHFNNNNMRPHLQLEESEHQLSKDFYQGISVERATEIAGAMFQVVEHADNQK